MLGKIQITNEQEIGSTSVSNTFIDEYMADANDAQIKVYLYLLRTLQFGRSTTVSEIADKFNHTERDIKNALIFWEKKGLVRLEYDSKKRLSQICIEDLFSSCPSNEVSEVSEVSEVRKTDKTVKENIPVKKSDTALSMTFFAAEKYFKRPLSSSETQSILYIYETLGFPAELIDYLLQYTVENAKGRLSSYMEKTAVAWHSEGICTLEAAKSRSGRFERYVYEIMKLLGLPNAPTSYEAAFSDRWVKDYGFSMEIIREACRRTVSNTQNHRFEYTEGILKNWRDRKVTSVSDIEKLDSEYDKDIKDMVRSKKPQAASAHEQAVQIDTKNRFNRFKSHDYDFDSLKETVLGNP